MEPKRSSKIHPRVIVNLLIDGASAINTINFQYDEYLGDPVNLVKIFNAKEVDEMIIASKSSSKDGIDYDLLGDIASNARFPISYVGGIETLQDASRIIQLGYEKISLCSSYSPQLLNEIASNLGSSAVSVSIDLKKQASGNYVQFKNKFNKTFPINLEDRFKEIEKNGGGEIILNYIDKDGSYSDYDLTHSNMLKKISIPVVINHGANSVNSMKNAYIHGYSAFSACSIFVFYGAEKGVLPSFPEFQVLQSSLKK